MNIERLKVNTSAAIPLMAALPYGIAVDQAEVAGIQYDPETQLTVFAGRNFSTSREDESVNPFFGKSKADTKKDD
jgi:hypothetical protein